MGIKTSWGVAPPPTSPRLGRSVSAPSTTTCCIQRYALGCSAVPKQAVASAALRLEEGIESLERALTRILVAAVSQEDPKNRKLKYACRTYDYEEDADNYCVYRNEIAHSSSEKTTVLLDVRADPTLPRTRDVRCPSK